MKQTLIWILLLVIPECLFAQILIGKVQEEKKHTASEVIDPVYGIILYEKLNFSLGGDSVRNTKKGYACQGWVEDYYEGGQILHKGYYVDGQLQVYKNYYENGQLERSFKLTSIKKSTMLLFYRSGQLKSEVNYYEGSPQLWKDFYSNGNPEFIEEYDKEMVYVIQRKSYFEDGKPESIFELINQKKKIYSKKDYYENGNIKDEGEMKFNPIMIDYQKEGKWKSYNEKGALISEELYSNGELKTN